MVNEDVFRILQGKRSGEVIQGRFRQLAVELAKDCLRAKGMDGVRLDATAHFLGGAFSELLSWYVNARKRPDIHGLDAMFQELAGSSLKVRS